MTAEAQRGSFCQRRAMVVISAIALCALAWLLPPDGAAGPNWLRAMGRFHPLVVHLPIAFALLVPVLDLLGRWRRRDDWMSTVDFIMLLAFLSACVAVIVGLALGHSDERQGDTVRQHMWAGMVATIALGIAWMARARWQKLAVPLAVGACLCVSVAGHLGGVLTHGSAYLGEYLPAPLAAVMGVNPHTTLGKHQQTTPQVVPLQSSAPTPAVTVWNEKIEPMLVRSCTSCHNATTHKAGLRLDEPAQFMGKKNLVVPGKPDDSELLRRVSLPATDDDFMPANHKNIWSAADIAFWRWWIQQGADPTWTMERVRQGAPAEIRSALSSPTSAVTPPTHDDESELSLAGWAAQWLALQKLATAQYVDVAPMSARESDGLALRCYATGARVTDATLTQLRPISPWVVEVDLSGSAITDAALTTLATWPQIRRLNVSRTAVYASGITALMHMSTLRQLICNDTFVDDTSCETLRSCRQLTTLALCRTQISRSGLASLRAALPNCLVGGDADVEVTAPTPAHEPAQPDKK